MLRRADLRARGVACRDSPSAWQYRRGTATGPTWSGGRRWCGGMRERARWGGGLARFKICTRPLISSLGPRPARLAPATCGLYCPFYGPKSTRFRGSARERKRKKGGGEREGEGGRVLGCGGDAVRRDLPVGPCLGGPLPAGSALPPQSDTPSSTVCA